MGFYHLYAYRKSRSKMVRYPVMLKTGVKTLPENGLSEPIPEEVGEHVCELPGCCKSTNSLAAAVLWGLAVKFRGGYHVGTSS